MSEPIKMWPFYEAPEELQKLSENGGDEDWLVLIPAEMAGREPHMPWLDNPGIGSIGVCDIDRFPQQDGTVVYIGSHA